MLGGEGWFWERKPSRETGLGTKTTKTLVRVTDGTSQGNSFLGTAPESPVCSLQSAVYGVPVPWELNSWCVESLQQLQPQPMALALALAYGNWSAPCFQVPAGRHSPLFFVRSGEYGCGIRKVWWIIG